MAMLLFEIGVYTITHYAYGGDTAGRLDLSSKAYVEQGQGPYATVDIRRNPNQPETAEIYYDDDGNVEGASALIHLSRLSEWIDTLRNEEPLWFLVYEGDRPFAALYTGEERVGENEPHPTA
jgi:hypothetical protein